jgi:two-component sensor histidine kinase
MVCTIYGIALFAKPVEISEEKLSYSNFDIKYQYLDDNQSFEFVKDTEFKNSSKSNFSLGFQDKTLWIKFRVKNSSDFESFIFTLNETFYETANIYYTDKNSWIKKENSLYTELANREIYFNKLSFKVDLAKDFEDDIYLQLKGKYSYFGNIIIYEQKEFLQKIFYDSNSLYLFIFGITFLVFLFSLVMFIVLREKLYFYYMGYNLFYLIYLIKMSGFLEFVGMQKYIYELHSSAPMFVVFLSLFSFEYLNLKEKLKSFSNYFYIIPIGFSVLAILLYMEYQPWNKVLNIASLLFCVFMLSISLYMYIKGDKKGKYYFYAMFIYFVFALVFLSMIAGVFEYTFFTRYSLIFGTSLENIIFMLMIVSRYRSLKDETEAKLIFEVEKRTQKLHHLAKEKELILQELYHRVKNNFHMIVGMLWLKSQKNKELQPLITRVESMALINELLYQSEDLENIDIKKYFKDIISNISQSYGEINIETKYDLSKRLSIKNGTNLGMIVNEVITNSIKHNTTQKLKIELSFVNIEDKFILSIQDNGEGFDIDKPNEGIGLSMIQELSKKLCNATYKYTINNGTKFVLEYTKV